LGSSAGSNNVPERRKKLGVVFFFWWRVWKERNNRIFIWISCLSSSVLWVGACSLGYLQRYRPKLENEKVKWVFVRFEIGDLKTCIFDGLRIQQLSFLFVCGRKLRPPLAHVLWPPPSTRAFWLPLARALRPRLKMQNRKEGCCRSAALSSSHCCRSRPDAVLRSRLRPWCPMPRHSSKLDCHAGARSAGGGGGARRLRWRCSLEDAGVG
jgi:hypothetical protein